VLVAGCSGGGRADSTATSGPATTQAAASGTVDGRFDAGGHQLYLRCQGAWSPTLVYLHGLGGDGTDVPSISGPLASRVRVCTYDRLNVGRSDTDPGRHTGTDSVRDLHTLLQTAGVPGPYLLVGFSFGGLLAIMYAGTYPDQVMGMLSLDGSLPTDDQIDRLIPANERAQERAAVEANQERVEVYRTLDQAKVLQAKVPDVPVTYMAARPIEVPPHLPAQRIRAFIQAQQARFARSFPKGRLVEVRSSHDIDLDQPERVIQEITRILDAA
jgi:pimeloyl-ACP methyl ester carboxylesterase